jgi:hypothetical protein
MIDWYKRILYDLCRLFIFISNKNAHSSIIWIALDHILETRPAQYRLQGPSAGVF